MVWNYSNLFMNMGGCGSWGGCGTNYAYGSGIAGLFDGVSGINCLFNYGDYGYSDCGCSSSVNWGHIIGSTAAWLLPAAGGMIAGAVQNNKAEKAAADQKFQNALKTLGISESTKPENLSVAEVQGKNFDDVKPEYKKAVDDAGKDENLKPGGKDESGWKTEISTLESNLNTLRSDLVNLEKDKPQEGTEDYDTLISEYNQKLEKLQKEINEQETALENAKKLKETARKNKEAYDKAVKNYNEAKEKFEEAKTAVANYLKEYQSQDLNKKIDDFDGTAASRALHKAKFQENKETGKIDGDVNNFEKTDWQKLLCKYRTGNSTEKEQVKAFLEENKDKIKGKKLDSSIQILIDSVLAA